MVGQQELCPVCNKPKKSGSAASITQWISACVCDLTPGEDFPSPAYESCQSCGKRIGEARQGSFTQFIFRPDFCSCGKPVLKKDREKGGGLDFYRTPDTLAEIEYREEDTIELPEEEFPIGRYKPFKLLGKGGSGAVYLSFDTLLRKNVAVKILQITESRQLIAFQEQARAISKLSHPSIIKVLDFGITEGQVPYMVLEYFSGESLDKLLEREGVLSWQLARAIGIEVCSAMEYSHSMDTFHYDLKPGNILVKLDDQKFPEVKIIDFSFMAGDKKTVPEPDSYEATPAYMSPDLLQGLPHDRCSEVYMLGCILFELLTDRQPYGGDTPIDVMHSHINEDTPRVDDFIKCPDELSVAIHKAMAKSKDERFQSFEEFSGALSRIEDIAYQGGVSELEGESTLGGNSWKTISLIAFSIFLLGLAGTHIYTAGKDKSESPPGKSNTSEGDKPETLSDFDDLFFVTRGDKSVKVSTRVNITDSDLKLLVKGVTGMKVPISINFEGQKIDGSGFKYLKTLPIERMNLTACKLSDDSALYLNELPGLRRLLVTDTGITDQFVFNLRIDAKAPIRSIDLRLNKKVTSNCLEHLARMPNLEVLNLNGAGIDNSHLEELVRLPGLTSLSIGHNNKISAEGIEKLIPIKNLHFLDLAFCPQLDSRAIELLTKFPQLGAVHIGGKMKIKPRDILAFNKAKKVERLAFYEIASVEEYVSLLPQLKHIKSIIVTDTAIDDDDLIHFTKIPQLRHLTILLAPNLSKEAIRELKTKLPPGASFDSDVSEYKKVSDVEELFLVE